MRVEIIIAVVLIIAGILGLVYGQFTYTSETHEAELGPLAIAIEERETVNIPTWAGAGLLVIGIVVLVYGLTRPQPAHPTSAPPRR